MCLRATRSRSCTSAFVTSDDPYQVDLTEPPAPDLEQIRRWLMVNADPDVADRFLTEVFDRIGALETLPERGSVLRMLEDLDDAVRQMPVRSWRLIYDVTGDVVSILAVVHERRNCVEALAERLRR